MPSGYEEHINSQADDYYSELYSHELIDQRREGFNAEFQNLEDALADQAITLFEFLRELDTLMAESIAFEASLKDKQK